jgi:hypothetical protein
MNDYIGILDISVPWILTFRIIIIESDRSQAEIFQSEGFRHFNVGFFMGSQVKQSTSIQKGTILVTAGVCSYENILSIFCICVTLCRYIFNNQKTIRVPHAGEKPDKIVESH